MSAEHNKAANATVAESTAREAHNKDNAHNDVMWDENAAKRETTASSAGSAAASRAQNERHFNATQAKGTNPMNANQMSDMFSDLLKGLSAEEKDILANDDSPEQKEYDLANIKGVRLGYQSQRLDFLKGKPVDIGYLTELEDVKNTPYNPQQVAPPTPAPNGGFSVRPRQ